jgi:multimeric flavodoxin WrbA
MNLMNIVILNGNPDETDSSFDGYLDAMVARLAEGGHVVTTFLLRSMEIRQCAGCFDCWIRSPGICPLDDDCKGVLLAFIASDLVIFASPLLMGFTSALLKTTTDRMLPLLLPYIDGASGECRHFLRYQSMPQMAILYAPECDTDTEDLDIVATMWQRLARNYRARLAFVGATTEPVEEVCSEIDRI